jgi:hypothetical protein
MTRPTKLAGFLCHSISGTTRIPADVIGFVSQFFSSPSGPSARPARSVAIPRAPTMAGLARSDRSLAPERTESHPPRGVLHDNSHSPGERVLADRRYGPGAATRTGVASLASPRNSINMAKARPSGAGVGGFVSLWRITACFAGPCDRGNLCPRCRSKAGAAGRGGIIQLASAGRGPDRVASGVKPLRVCSRR